MYIEIILLVGFSMVISLLMYMIPKDTELLDVLKVFSVVLFVLTIWTLGIYFATDWLLA